MHSEKHDDAGRCCQIGIWTCLVQKEYKWLTALFHRNSRSITFLSSFFFQVHPRWDVNLFCRSSLHKTNGEIHWYDSLNCQSRCYESKRGKYTTSTGMMEKRQSVSPVQCSCYQPEARSTIQSGCKYARNDRKIGTENRGKGIGGGENVSLSP